MLRPAEVLWLPTAAVITAQHCGASQLLAFFPTAVSSNCTPAQEKDNKKKGANERSSCPDRASVYLPSDIHVCHIYPTGGTLTPQWSSTSARSSELAQPPRRVSHESVRGGTGEAEQTCEISRAAFALPSQSSAHHSLQH